MLVPQGRKHFEFLKAEGQIESVGAVVVIVSAHLHGLNLQKGIALPRGGIGRFFKDVSAVFFFYPIPCL